MRDSQLPHPHPAALFRETSEGGVLLQLEDEVYFGVNSVGARIWALLPPECGHMDELCDQMQSAYPEVGRDTLLADIEEFLELLKQNGLVVPNERVSP